MPARCPICDEPAPSGATPGQRVACARCQMHYTMEAAGAPQGLDAMLPTAGHFPGGGGAPPPPQSWPGPDSQPSQPRGPRPGSGPPLTQDRAAQYARHTGDTLRRQRFWKRVTLFVVLLIIGVSVAVVYTGMSVMDFLEAAQQESAQTMAQVKEELVGPPANLEDTEDPGVLDTLLSGDSKTRIKGHYEERIEVRNGKKVRIWVPRDTPQEQPQEDNGRAAQRRARRSAGNDADKPDRGTHRKQAPEVSFHTDQGDRVEISALRGKVVVLNFYANWCPPCRREIPELARFHSQDAGSDVVIYGVLSQSGPDQQAAAQSRKLGVNYPLLMGRPEHLRAFGATAFPTTVVVDKKGRIVRSWRGGISYPQLQGLVEEAL